MGTAQDAMRKLTVKEMIERPYDVELLLNAARQELMRDVIDQMADQVVHDVLWQKWGRGLWEWRTARSEASEKFCPLLEHLRGQVMDLALARLGVHPAPTTTEAYLERLVALRRITSDEADELATYRLEAIKNMYELDDPIGVTL